MENKIKIFFMILSSFSSSCCVHASEVDVLNFTCVIGEICSLSGEMTMSNDGHGYIGSIDVGGGKCVNVSFDDHFSRRAIKDRPKKMKVSGKYLPYWRVPNQFVLVNGRRIGEGVCGDGYIFVK